MSEDNERMNKSSVGASMQELKQMHQVSTTAVPAAEVEAGVASAVVKKVRNINSIIYVYLYRVCYTDCVIIIYIFSKL